MLKERRGHSDSVVMLSAMSFIQRVVCDSVLPKFYNIISIYDKSIKFDLKIKLYMG